MMEKNPSSEIGVILCGDFNSTPPFGVLQYCLGRLEVEMLILYLSGDLFNSYKLAPTVKRYKYASCDVLFPHKLNLRKIRLN